MSVIAKMYALNTPRTFSQSQQVDLQCVCDERIMTVPRSEPVPGRVEENQSFSTASPSGDCRFSLGLDEPVARQEEFYLIFLQQFHEAPSFDNAIMVSQVRCVSVTDFGGTSKQVEVCSDYSQSGEHPKQSGTFNMRMMIDNPAASVQFQPGKGGYWLGIYRANQYDIHEALADAHA